MLGLSSYWRYKYTQKNHKFNTIGSDTGFPLGDFMVSYLGPTDDIQMTADRAPGSKVRYLNFVSLPLPIHY